MEDDTVAEDAQHKPKRTKTTKASTAVPSTRNKPGTGQRLSKDMGEKDDENKRSMKPETKVPLEKMSTELALGDLAAQPTNKTKTKKRKAADLDVEDESQPQKRKSRPRPQSRLEATTTETGAEVILKKNSVQSSSGINNANQAIADAINHASGVLNVDYDAKKLAGPAGASGRLKVSIPKESWSKRTHAQGQAEVHDDPPLPQKEHKTNLSRAPKTILRLNKPDYTTLTENNTEPAPQHVKEAKPIKESGQGQRKSQ